MDIVWRTSCSDRSQAVRAVSAQGSFVRDNCVYREQKGQSRPPGDAFNRYRSPMAATKHSPPQRVDPLRRVQRQRASGDPVVKGGYPCVRIAWCGECGRVLDLLCGNSETRRRLRQTPWRPLKRRAPCSPCRRYVAARRSAAAHRSVATGAAARAQRFTIAVKSSSAQACMIAGSKIPPARRRSCAAPDAGRCGCA